MKKLLIIQTDETYFLLETLLTLERLRTDLNIFDIRILAQSHCLEKLRDGSCDLNYKILTSDKELKNEKFDLSVNLSLNEESWRIHNEIFAEKKIGPRLENGQLLVPDYWSSYLLTLKSKAPFLTFHLQDIYRNILGIRKMVESDKKHLTFRQVIFQLLNPDLFSPQEQELFLEGLANKFPNLKIYSEDEVDTISDLSQTLYIGPASITGLKFCENGATGLFLTAQFQGFNLLPQGENHLLVSSKGKNFNWKELLNIAEARINQTPITESSPYSLYAFDHENLYGTYLKSLNHADLSYPVYQAHVVIWNFILNLFDTSLQISPCSHEQKQMLRSQCDVLTKLLRLFDFGKGALDIVYQECKKSSFDGAVVKNHMNEFNEIQNLGLKISATHPFLRPVLDYYHIRMGQNDGPSLQEQVQHTYLTFSEQYQALSALMELFTVTLNKNEATI